MRFGKLFCYVIIAGTVMFSLSMIMKTTEKNMQYSPELQEAWDVINGLQSLFLSDTYTGASTESEILELGEKVLKIRDAFAFNNDRIEVLRGDQAYFEGEVRAYLATLFPLANNIDQAIEGLKQPAAFITAYSDYVATVPTLLATSLDVSVSDLPDASDSFWEDVFEITKDAREIRARLRGSDWLENFEEKLCIPTESGVDMIAFDRNSSGNVVYAPTETLVGACQGTNGSSMHGNTPVCRANQIQDTWSSEECQYGCADGKCLPEPDVPVTLSHFELYKKQDIETVAINDDPDKTEEYRFDLVVVATNSDDSIDYDYDGEGLIIVTGDGDAEFPAQVNITLDAGIGIFPITLTKLADVSISYKDVGNKINGNELVSALQIYQEQVICPAVFMPVCATTQNADGEKIWKTYTSQCDAEQENAQIEYEEACEIGELVENDTVPETTDPELQAKYDIINAILDRVDAGETIESIVRNITDEEREVLESAIDGSLWWQKLFDLRAGLGALSSNSLNGPGGTEDRWNSSEKDQDFYDEMREYYGSDDDGDGEINLHDYCDNDPNKVDLGVCGCGTPDDDSDGDGTPDCNDPCPNDADDRCNEPCYPDYDSDGDGTCDADDSCPNDPDNRCIDPCYDNGGDSDGDGICDTEDMCPDDPTDSCDDWVCEGYGGDTDNDSICDDYDICPDDPADLCDENFPELFGDEGCSDEDYYYGNC